MDDDRQISHIIGTGYTSRYFQNYFLGKIIEVITRPSTCSIGTTCQKYILSMWFFNLFLDHRDLLSTFISRIYIQSDDNLLTNIMNMAFFEKKNVLKVDVEFLWNISGSLINITFLKSANLLTLYKHYINITLVLHYHYINITLTLH